MDDQEAAAMFKALGDPTRLRMYKFLRSCCSPVAISDEGEVRSIQGPTVGEVCCTVTGATKVTSTVSFHLKELRNAGLIRMEKRGKHVVCGIEPDAALRLKQFFEEDEGCC